jgi:sucrase/ferredoxin-like protein
VAVSAERCSARSEDLGEPMLGTASTVRTWLLVEHAGPWGQRPLLDARLPDGLGRELRRLERTLGIRVLLIRRPDRDLGESGTCFAIRSGPNDPWIEKTALGRPRDVLDLDLDALSRGRSPGLDRFDGPLFAVCTHGRHDPCCAERGRPLALRLSVVRPEETWESTHVGGDRFAGNLIAFPHGWYFGRVGAEAGPVVAGAYVDGRVELAHARGRSCFPIDVQAAELFLRADRRLDGLDAVAPRAVERTGGRTIATFRTDDGTFVVRVERSPGVPRPLTCRATEALAPPAFDLVAIDRRG